ncbi:MAG: hypothetical protein IPK74_40280 [Deltaproteobacteria bacterium]|nr:hypothetical protein [Deltaproteobacteria bacterium]
MVTQWVNDLTELVFPVDIPEECSAVSANSIAHREFHCIRKAGGMSSALTRRQATLRQLVSGLRTSTILGRSSFRTRNLGSNVLIGTLRDYLRELE